jgi:hypothetical protein
MATGDMDDLDNIDDAIKRLKHMSDQKKPGKVILDLKPKETAAFLKIFNRGVEWERKMRELELEKRRLAVMADEWWLDMRNAHPELKDHDALHVDDDGKSIQMLVDKH